MIKMVEQKPISVRSTTYDIFIKVKIQFQAKIQKQLLQDEFLLELLECIIKAEGLKIE